jgi:hypothetical protein
MSQGGMGGGYGSPALHIVSCTLHELAWQQAVWSFAQGRMAYEEAWDASYRRE